MARNGSGAVKVRKMVDVVMSGKEAVDVGDRVAKGINEYVSAETDMGEAQQGIKNATERWERTFGLNKRAMKALVAVYKMDETKKADFLRTFLPGLEIMLPDQLDIFADTEQGEASKAPSEKKKRGGKKAPTADASPSIN
jgi:phage-related minor tail protein